ncbi:hypothetical protein KJ854_06070 [Patescibacteria group bacterium]|nr:hypothetical protein [Patescibacteria group bacterium]
MQHRDNYDEKRILKAFGIKFLEKINESYQYVVLPSGWRLQNFATLLDEKNRQRARREQYFNEPVLKVLTRYEVHAINEKGEIVIINGNDFTINEYIELFTINVHSDNGAIITINAFDSDAKKNIFSTKVNYTKLPKNWQGRQRPQFIETETKKYLKAIDDAEKKVTQWLDDNYREWKNPGAYW